MRNHTLAIFFSLFLAGFAYTLFYASEGSGTDGGDLWLLTSLILGVGLIATSLAAITLPLHARFFPPRRTASPSVAPLTPPILPSLHTGSLVR